MAPVTPSAPLCGEGACHGHHDQPPTLSSGQGRFLNDALRGGGLFAATHNRPRGTMSGSTSPRLSINQKPAHGQLAERPRRLHGLSAQGHCRQTVHPHIGAAGMSLLPLLSASGWPVC